MLSDLHNRTFRYLRLSVTEVCNFKCVYCLPNGYQKPKSYESPLTISEIKNLVTGFAELGIEKVRLTGGEPTVREDILEIVRTVHEVPGIQTVALTTNGFRLKKLANALKSAGLSSINVSVDSLDPEHFHKITGQNTLKEILAGIEAASQAGISNIKINAVLLKNLTDVGFEQFLKFIEDKKISVRFIELMQTHENTEFFNQRHLSAGTIQYKLAVMGWQRVAREATSGPAIEYSHPHFLGKIGLIAPYSKDFCQSCNRLRVRSTGRLRLCLFGDSDHSLRPLLQETSQKEELISEITRITRGKLESHLLDKGIYGNTSNFSAIGG